MASQQIVKPLLLSHPSIFCTLCGVAGADPENSEREDRVPLPPPRMKTSIITTLKGRLEGWESYKHVLKIQEKKGAAAPPLNPPMGSSLFLKIHEKKSCIRVSLGNVYRQGMWFWV